MTERERLIELLCSAPLGSKTFEQQYYKSTITKIADYLLAEGVIVPTCEEWIWQIQFLWMMVLLNTYLVKKGQSGIITEIKKNINNQI